MKQICGILVIILLGAFTVTVVYFTYMRPQPLTRPEVKTIIHTYTLEQPGQIDGNGQNNIEDGMSASDYNNFEQIVDILITEVNEENDGTDTK